MNNQVETIDYKYFFALLEENVQLVEYMRQIAPTVQDGGKLDAAANIIEDNGQQIEAFIHALKASLEHSDENIGIVIKQYTDREAFAKSQALVKLMNAVGIDEKKEGDELALLLSGTVEDDILRLFGNDALSALRKYAHEVKKYRSETVYEDTYSEEFDYMENAS